MRIEKKITAGLRLGQIDSEKDEVDFFNLLIEKLEQSVSRYQQNEDGDFFIKNVDSGRFIYFFEKSSGTIAVELFIAGI